MKPVNRSIYSYFADFANECPDKQFFFDEDSSFTVKETFASAIAAANDLVKLGVKPGSLVALRTTRTIEAGIKSLPYVLDACVVGIKDETRGEIPCALVVVNDRSKDIIADLPSVLKKIETPAHVDFADAIPLLSSGKPDKMSVKKLFEKLCNA